MKAIFHRDANSGSVGSPEAAATNGSGFMMAPSGRIIRPARASSTTVEDDGSVKSTQSDSRYKSNDCRQAATALRLPAKAVTLLLCHSIVTLIRAAMMSCCGQLIKPRAVSNPVVGATRAIRRF